jgi:uncharacterized damage-inducible protein DinB
MNEHAAPSPEFWLRGPVAGIAGPLQPVAHALLQAREDVESIMAGFPDTMLWARPAGVASVGFHLRHIEGVIDRLLTYARDEPLSAEQLRRLAAESDEDQSETGAELVRALGAQIERAIEQLRLTDQESLEDARWVGRRRLPSSVRGLLFHAAEHAQRHVGQLLVTARVVRATGSERR